MPSYNSFLFFRYVNYMLNYMINYIVGAPTFSFLHATMTSQERTASEGGPYTNCELSTGNCKLSPCTFFPAPGIQRVFLKTDRNPYGHNRNHAPNHRRSRI